MEENAILTAIIILSMVMTPLYLALHDRLMPKTAVSMDGMEAPEDDGDAVLLIGFGRFGQVVSQPLLSTGHRVSIIDSDPEMIRTARTFGFKVYFGDGTRLDTLRAAGAMHARAVVIAVDNQGAATRIAHLLHDICPMVPVFARAYDRRHAIALIRAGAVDPIRETYESAIQMGADVLRRLGSGDNVVTDTIAEVRRRDAKRFALQLAGDEMSGKSLLVSNVGIAMENSG